MASDEQERPLHLLLLPPPPHPIKRETLKAAYTVPLTSTFKQLASERRGEAAGAILEIALPVQPLLSSRVKARSASYPQAQCLIAGVYRLICIIAARESINMEDVKGIDIRLLMLAYPPPEDAISSTVTGDLVTPIVNIQTLARSQRPWSIITGVEGEEGERLLRAFLTSQDGRVKFQRVKGGVVQMSQDAADIVPEEDRQNVTDRDYTSIALGGTFDHIHLGHKLLLSMFTFLLPPSDANNQGANCLIVGITGDELLKNKKYPELLESWEERQKKTVAFLQSVTDFRPTPHAQIKSENISKPGPNGHAIHHWLGDSLVIKCVEISDPFGPTITEKDIFALVVSGETRGGGKAVNDKRREKSWPELEIFEVDVLDGKEEVEGSSSLDDSFEAKLSSTTIRKAISERIKKGSL